MTQAWGALYLLSALPPCALFFFFWYVSIEVFRSLNIEPLKKKKKGVPVVAQWLKNPTRNDEVAGSVPGLAQRVKDLALL